MYSAQGRLPFDGFVDVVSDFVALRAATAEPVYSAERIGHIARGVSDRRAQELIAVSSVEAPVCPRFFPTLL